MTMDARMSVAFAASRTKTTTFRNLRWCGYWTILALTSGASSIIIESGMVHLAWIAIFFYALQALGAEALGVRISDGTIWAPRRINAHFPQLVFWRTGGYSCDVGKMVSVSKAPHGDVAILRWGGNVDLPILFASRDAKLSFFEALRRLRPDLGFRRRA